MKPGGIPASEFSADCTFVLAQICYGCTACGVGTYAAPDKKSCAKCAAGQYAMHKGLQHPIEVLSVLALVIVTDGSIRPYHDH